MPKKVKPTNQKLSKHSKEEAKRHYDLVLEANRQRRIVRDQVYPILLKNAKSVRDANVILQVTKQAIQQAFANQKKIQTIGQLKVVENIDPKADRADMYRELIGIFTNDTLLVAEQLIEGTGYAIDSFIAEEMDSKPLNTLKTDFLSPDDDIKPNGTV